MEKKKMLKIIMLVVVIILMIFIIATARKVIILTSLKNKIAEYKQSSDVHMKTESEEASIETYIKEDIYKTVLHFKEQNAVVTQITDYNANEGRTYWETKDGKVLQIRNNDFEFLKVIPIFSFADSSSMFETIVNSIVSNIYTEEVDNQECYVIESKKNTNFVFEEKVINIKAYINKDTGLSVKKVELLQEDDGSKKERITTYEYKFNSIIDEDMQEPDRAEFTIKQD